jgi:Septum formation initiator
MAKNRKSQSAAIRFGPALKGFFLCFVIAGSAVGYVWQKSRVYQLGQEISQGEAKLKHLRSENQTLSGQLAILRSPVALDQRSRELNLGLVPSQPSQVIFLVEPVAPSGNKNLTRQLAARRAGAPLTQ